MMTNEEEIKLLQYDLNAVNENRIKVLTRRRIATLIEATLFRKKHLHHQPCGCVTVDSLEKQLIEVVKLQDFASSTGDSEGYMRLCGQFVLLERLIDMGRKGN